VVTDLSTTATVVGGVSELYQGDLDLGRRVAEILAVEEFGPGVAVEDLHYGAVAVTQRIEDLAPDSLILVGATVRGRDPGTVHRRRIPPPELDEIDLQTAVGDAVTGYVAIDLIVEVAAALGALPGRVIAVEVEPVRTGPIAELSTEVASLLPDILAQVRREVRLAPLYVLVDRLVETLADGHLGTTPATETLTALLDELRDIEGSDRWGHVSVLRDRLRGALAEAQVAPEMDHRDWALTWNLIEELDRLAVEEARRLAQG
jgi:Ni,Fe-hydrogenase maturation factor